MNASVIVPALTTAVSIGLGCGTCCSPIISTFLSSYVVSHSGGVKKGFCHFLVFLWKNVQCFPDLYRFCRDCQAVYREGWNDWFI